MSILRSIKRENSNIEGLCEFLQKSDFFTAPCSSKFHLGIAGGLCLHSLNVYFNLCFLNDLKQTNLDEDTLKILGLCHDLGKIGVYEQYIQNKKVYSDLGSSSDSIGKFEWISVPAYKKRDIPFVLLGSHGEMSEYITRCYIPLRLQETSAIYNHHSGFDAPPSTNLTAIYNQYSECILLHLADMLSCYVDERYEPSN